MRVLLTLLPALAMAQTPPASTPATPSKATAPAKKAAATTPKKAATAPAKSAAAAAVHKPAATGAGRGAVKPKPAAAAAKPLATDQEKTIYAIGLSLGRSLTMFNLTPPEVEIVKRGIGDAVNNKPEVELSEWASKIEPMARERATVIAEKQKALSTVYLAKCATEPGAVKTESGLVYKELKVGTRRIAQGHRHGQGPLPRHAHRRHRIRQFLQAQ